MWGKQDYSHLPSAAGGLPDPRASMTTATADLGPQRSFLDVWLISIGHTFTHWYPSTFYILLPLIGKELGLNYAQIASIYTCQFAAGAICNVPGGIIVDSVSRKGLLMAISLGWVGIPYLLMGQSYHYWIMLCCAVLIGIGNQLWHPVAIPLLGNLYPQRRGLMMSFHSMGANVGDAIGPLVAGALLTFMSWRGVVTVNVLPGMLMALLLLTHFRDLRTSDHRVSSSTAAASTASVFRGFSVLLHNRTVTMLAVGAAFRSITQVSLLIFVPVYIAHVLGYSEFWIGACMFALQACGFAAAPIAGHLSDTIGRRQVIVASFALTAAVLLAMALAGHSVLFVVCVAILGFFLFAMRAVLQAWMLDATPKHLGGTAIGFMFGMQSVGAALGPFIGGVIADHFGLSTTFYFLTGTILIANVFMVLTPVPEREPALAAAE